MTYRILVPGLLAVLALAACSDSAPPPATPEATAPVEMQAPPSAAPPAAAPVPLQPPPLVDPGFVPSPTPAPPQEYGGITPQESYVSKAATAAIPAEAIGGSPVTNENDAWFRGHAALQKYCEDQRLPFDAFRIKEKPVKTGAYWTMQYFGAPNGQGTFVGIRVFPDGRAEIIL